jgi:hypothetical protein
MNYDPNYTLCGMTAKQEVKLTFGLWNYRAERIVTVGGNCNGFTVIESAVGVAYEELPYLGDEDDDDDVCAWIDMQTPDGKEMRCEDDECRGEDWLKDMLIKAEIISITPDDQ